MHFQIMAVHVVNTCICAAVYINMANDTSFKRFFWVSGFFLVFQRRINMLVVIDVVAADFYLVQSNLINLKRFLATKFHF